MSSSGKFHEGCVTPGLAGSGFTPSSSRCAQDSGGGESACDPQLCGWLLNRWL